ncbi:aspartate-semialdehyde dehydrogenase [bacterium]|nr:aspartate-semialdehyde dehydrogenase [bacterium]
MERKEYKVAVVGATGAVGREMVSILQERDFPVAELRLLASPKSLGEGVEFKGKDIPVQTIGYDTFDGIEIVLLAAGSTVSKEVAPKACERGALVIDNSSAFRRMPEIPLTVPEVNEKTLHELCAKRKGAKGLLVANPNCSTIQLVVALNPLKQAYGLNRVIVSSYQSVSGAGQKGIRELSEQSRSLFSMQEMGAPEIFPAPIAFNCIPQIGSFDQTGYSEEEDKIMFETKKILEDQTLAVAATAVRVPVFHTHSESVYVELKKDVPLAEIIEMLRKAQGIVLDESQYPMPRDVAGADAVYVGRVRKDPSNPLGVHFWVVADNLRKGAALNAVQIAESALKYL